jgi:hypothetical protein
MLEKVYSAIGNLVFFDAVSCGLAGSSISIRAGVIGTQEITCRKLPL